MNLRRSVLLLVATSLRRAYADDRDDASSIVVNSMLQKTDPDHFLQLVALKESNRDVSIPTVRACFSKAMDPFKSESKFCLG